MSAYEVYGGSISSPLTASLGCGAMRFLRPTGSCVQESATISHLPLFPSSTVPANSCRECAEEPRAVMRASAVLFCSLQPLSTSVLCSRSIRDETRRGDPHACCFASLGSVLNSLSGVALSSSPRPVIPAVTEASLHAGCRKGRQRGTAAVRANRTPLLPVKVTFVSSTVASSAAITCPRG
jgi:hypothetical protein